MSQKVLLSAKEINIILHRLACQLLENHLDFKETVLIGIQPRGIFLADRLTKLLKEEYGAKDYLSLLNIADARLKFALRTCMTRSVQANFKNDPVYKSNEWKCQECQVLDTQEHIVRCPVYASIRSGKDLHKDKDLVEYFRKVIDLRSNDNL